MDEQERRAKLKELQSIVMMVRDNASTPFEIMNWLFDEVERLNNKIDLLQAEMEQARAMAEAVEIANAVLKDCFDKAQGKWVKTSEKAPKGSVRVLANWPGEDEPLNWAQYKHNEALDDWTWWTWDNTYEEWIWARPPDFWLDWQPPEPPEANE